MSTLAPSVMGLIAVASVAGGNPPTYNCQRGFSSAAIARTGAGDYTMTLQDGVNAQTQGLIQATPGNGTMAAVSVEWLTTTTVRVRLAVLAAAPTITATDMNYWIQIQELGPA